MMNMNKVIYMLLVCGMYAGCKSESPTHVVFNMSEDERPFGLVIDAIENDTIYVSVFEDTLRSEIIKTK